MTKFILNIVLAIFLIALTNGCSNTTTKVTSNAKHANTNENPPVYVSTLLGIHNDKVYDSENNWFKIQENSVFSPEIKIGNDYPHENKYSLLFFIDYKQISVEYNKQQKNFIDINMKKNSEQNLSVTINNLEKGKHNFMVLLIRKPYDYIKKDQSVVGLEVYISQQKTLVVGEDIKKDTSFKSIEAQEKTIDGSLFVTKNMNDKFEQQLNVLKKTEASKYWLHLPSWKGGTKYILLAIAGNKQLDIKDPYIEVKNKGVVDIPLKDIKNISSLRTPNNFTVIAVEDDSSNMDSQPLYTNKISMVK